MEITAYYHLMDVLSFEPVNGPVQFSVHIVVVGFSTEGNDAYLVIMFGIDVQLLPLRTVQLLKRSRMPGAVTCLRVKPVKCLDPLDGSVRPPIPNHSKDALTELGA
jgi:hypothetical protein